MYVSKASVGVQLLSHCRHQWSPTPTSIPGAWGTRNPGPVRGSERALASQNPRERVGPPCPVGFGDAGGSLGPNNSSISGPALKNNRFGTVGEGSGRRRAARIAIAFNIERQSNTFRPSTLPTPDAIEFVLVYPRSALGLWHALLGRFWVGFRLNLAPRPVPTGRARKMVRTSPNIKPGDQF